MKEQISRLRQCSKELLDQIEIIISDNCSTDDTETIVRSAMSDGFECVYNKNKENLGMDGNFVTCFKMARGKYVWLLGDDDPIIPNALAKIVKKLSGEDNFGLVHIYKKERFSEEEFITYMDDNEYVRTISYYTTLISSNIVQTKYVPEIDFDKYMGTWFTLMPLYISALVKEEKNLLVNFDTFEYAKDWKRNGGYNYFKVFAENYLMIWQEFLAKGSITRKTYNYLKKDSFKDLVAGPIYQRLIYGNKRETYSYDNAWRIIFRNYGNTFYFYYYPTYLEIVRNFQRVKRLYARICKN